MLTYSECIELRDKLLSDEIDIKSALEIYWKDYEEGKRSWHSKDWKDRRVQFLKDECEICGSKDTLTVQHRSHPKKYAEYKNEVTRAFTQEHRATNPLVDKKEFVNYVSEKYEYSPVPFCSHCNLSNPYKRVKKKPMYRCTSCYQEFDNPNYISLDNLIAIFYENEDALEVREKCFTSKDQWKNKQNLSNIKYWMQREHAKEVNIELIEREAFLLYLADDLKYLSFEDAITACKRCAASYDLHRLELCPKCQKNFRSIEYPTCIQCLPEESRAAVLASIEFGKKMREMERNLGID